MRKLSRKVMAFFSAFLILAGTVLTGFQNIRAEGKITADHIMIYEIYGGGGNSGAVYKNDYIILYNPTGTDVNLDGWSVQYASAKGKFKDAITTLSGNMKSGSYYLIEEAPGSGGTQDLPTPDASGSIAMAGGKGKVALVKSVDNITGKDDANVIDFVGYGTTNEYEGTAAPAPTNQKSIARKDKNIDTNDNGNDFQITSIDPKNSNYREVAANQVANVTVQPKSGEIPSGQELSMSCTTEGAEIHYQINGSTDTVYQDSAKPAIVDLPATVTVWAEKSGLTTSEKDVYQYTQSQTSAVSATPASGSVQIGSQVILGCPTKDAKITYSIDNGVTWNDYTDGITIDKLPCTVLAKAIAQGCAESTVTTYNYKLKTEKKHTGDYNIYFGQLHSHTNLSDGAGSVETAYDYASKVSNLDFLAVTDHSNSFEDKTYTNTLTQDAMANEKWSEGKNAAAAITAQKISNADNRTDADSTFLGVYGFEMTWSDGSGHINTFHTPGFENRNNTVFANKKQSASNPSGLSEYYDRLAQVNGSISQFNHPGTTFGDFYDFTNYSTVNDQSINLIEVGNGEGAIGSSGYFPSYGYYTRALDKGWHVAPTNNQDNHKGKWGDSNTARSVILADELTEESLYDALQNRRVYATEDNDLSIQYTLNGNVMGSILSDHTDQININAKISDPTDASIGKVEVIVDGGRTVAEKVVSDKDADITFSLDNNYSYYYLRITQPDGNLAVTAPVWTGEVEKAGIASVTTDTELPISGESMDVTTTLYNNETDNMTISKLQYSVDGKVIRSVDGADMKDGATVASLSNKTDTFSYQPDVNGDVTITATLTASIGGVEKTYQENLKLSVADPDTVTKVLIDGTHLNDYVNGYYKGNMTNFIQICAAQGIQAKIETDTITKEKLDYADMVVVTAPLKYDKTGELTPTSFSEDFMKSISEYVNGGGTAIICGIADYQDSSSGDPYTTTTQINDLLQTIGAKTSINSDEVYDMTNNDGSPYRLKLSNINTNSKWLTGVASEQKYSVYSGCTVNPATKDDWLVKGPSSTYSINSKKLDNSKYESPVEKNGKVMADGDACVLSTEQVGKGQIFVAGSVFLSNFEVKATMDNYSDLQYSNYTIINNILESVKKEIPVTSIKDIRTNGKKGDVYAVEGIVTAGSEGDNAFFDTVYIQDETGGIDIFPIANGSGVQIGQKLHVVGHVDYYQGDMELKIGSGIEGYSIVDTTIHNVTPSQLTAKDAMNYSVNGGKLVKVSGTVSDIVKEGGKLSSFKLDDGSGQKARIYLNGNVSGETDLSKVVVEGKKVSATGIVYMDPEGTCIRVRDGKEVVSVTDNKEPDSKNTDDNGNGGNGNSGNNGSGNNENGNNGTNSGKNVPDQPAENSNDGENKVNKDQSVNENSNENQVNSDATTNTDTSSVGVVTGDQTNVSAWKIMIIISGLAFAGAMVAIIIRKKRKHEKTV